MSPELLTFALGVTQVLAHTPCCDKSMRICCSDRTRMDSGIRWQRWMCGLAQIAQCLTVNYFKYVCWAGSFFQIYLKISVWCR